MAKMTFSEQIEYLLFTGAIEGQAIYTLYNLLKSYEQGFLTAEDMQCEINSFNPKFRLEALQDEYRDRWGYQNVL
jgi:hypothetical protein